MGRDLRHWRRHSYEGIVYQKDLGPNTLEIFQKMEAYNPDKTWQPTDANW
jgi:hypothetical protein